MKVAVQELKEVKALMRAVEAAQLALSTRMAQLRESYDQPAGMTLDPVTGEWQLPVMGGIRR